MNNLGGGFGGILEFMIPGMKLGLTNDFTSSLVSGGGLEELINLYGNSFEAGRREESDYRRGDGQSISEN